MHRLLLLARCPCQGAFCSGPGAAPPPQGKGARLADGSISACSCSVSLCRLRFFRSRGIGWSLFSLELLFPSRSDPSEYDRWTVLTSDGTVEMEASIMDGIDMRCGAVSGLSTVVNPISLARLVMDKTPHIYLAFEGAEAFARDQGVEIRDQGHFITEENIERLRNAEEANRVQVL